MDWKEKQKTKIIQKLNNYITGIQDICGDVQPSGLFYFFADRCSYLLTKSPEKLITKGSIRFHKVVNPIIRNLCPLFMEYKQTITVANLDALTKEPVIWCANHGFKDDVAATIHATRLGYILFGSLPHFYNTFDGVAAWLNGVIMCNRKVKLSRQKSVEGADRAIQLGANVTIFPEGVWNKTPNELVLPLWPGIYRIARENGCKVVPVIHYLVDPHKKYKGNVIHTVVAEPVSMEGLSEKEGLELLRDTMATQYYLLMEQYGQSTRQEVLDGFESADEAWDDYMAMHTGFQKYYDKEIELCADYRPKDIVRPESVWASIANIKNVQTENILHIQYAKALIMQEQRRAFQRKF